MELHILIIDTSIESAISNSTFYYTNHSLKTIVLSTTYKTSELLNELVLEGALNIDSKGFPVGSKCKLDSDFPRKESFISQLLLSFTTVDAVSSAILESILRILQIKPIRPLLLVYHLNNPSTPHQILGSNAIVSYCLLKYGGFNLNDDYLACLDWLNWSDDFICSLNCVSISFIKRLLLQLDQKLTDCDYLINNKSSLVDLSVFLTINGSINELNCNVEMYRNIHRYLLNSKNEFSRLRDKISRNSNSFDLKQLDICSSSKRPFFITAAIVYANGLPHIGHAYEAISCDVISRFYRLFGRKVLFSIGTDEHGLKVANKASKEGKAPIEICDYYSSFLRKKYEDLMISNDVFTRTTDKRHYKVSQAIWERIMLNGDIYLGEYNGWYSVREERFIPNSEALLTDYKDPSTGKPYDKMAEPSYFFTMEKYREKLINYINGNPDFIRPERTRNEILSRLTSPLEDLSISRTSFDWGIPVPNDSKHVMYVWMDALSNYLTVSGSSHYDSDLDTFLKDSMWPADIQVIGKDIAWFHCVIWSCILLSLGLELPRTIFSHGFVQSATGVKMSKSIGNIIDIDSITDKFGVEALRYFIMRSSIFGADINLDLSSLVDLFNAELADTIGNLVHRVTNLTNKYSNGEVPPLPEDLKIYKPFDPKKLAFTVVNSLKHYDIQTAILATINAFKDCNVYLTKCAPWFCPDPELRNGHIRVLLESIYFLSHFLLPIVPQSAEKIFEKINTPPKDCVLSLSTNFDNLDVNTKVVIGDILFSKLTLD